MLHRSDVAHTVAAGGIKVLPLRLVSSTVLSINESSRQ